MTAVSGLGEHNTTSPHAPRPAAARTMPFRLRPSASAYAVGIARADALEKAIDQLYGLPVDEFTAARDALVKERRAAADKAAADTVKALRKPTVAAWAVNQLSRKQRSALEDLVDLGERLRDAQRSAMSGGSAAVLRDLSTERRKAVESLTKKAMRLLGPSGDSQREAIAATLEAAVASPDAGDAACPTRR